MSDARLHGDKPIDDEVPFGDARKVPRDEAPEDDDAIVTPVAAQRERTQPDRDVEPSGGQQTGSDPERQGGHP